MFISYLKWTIYFFLKKFWPPSKVMCIFQAKTLWGSNQLWKLLTVSTVEQRKIKLCLLQDVAIYLYHLSCWDVQKQTNCFLLIISSVDID